MSGVLWAAVAGIGFGLFQTVNRLAMRDLDVLPGTFMQLVVSGLVLVAPALATADLQRLPDLPRQPLLDFAAAGLLHFFAGWTLLNASHRRVGAARTSPLVATVPVFATALAAATLREIPDPPALAAIAAVVTGVALVTTGSPAEGAHARRRRDALFGLGAALCWATSPLFIRRGLADVPSPLLGVTVGLGASALAYAVVLTATARWPSWATLSRRALLAKAVAGVLVGLSTWTRWIALSLAPVGVVLAVAMLSVPTVLVLSPRVVGAQVERVTVRVWAGALCTVAGALALVLRG
ncbi:MAG: EamA family transporter [Armatimonadota bacterium]|nr:EamA family transporter [Armatimonadota bacterium]MDR7529000.1 EamA family transporter [Armatimonadota bacterium]